MCIKRWNSTLRRSCTRKLTRYLNGTKIVASFASLHILTHYLVHLVRQIGNLMKRPEQHITETKSHKRIFENIIPVDWVCRDIKPDYGIDFLVEIFR